ncbi:3-ketosteroid-9-alpha-monooxygenase oxygenase subunit [compost metagenome]
MSRLLTNIPGNVPIETYEILAHYPVHANKFVLHMGFITRNSPMLPPEHNAARAAAVAEAYRVGTLQDVAIWRTKTRIDNPLLCDSDGPLYQLRRWYQQFFEDIADIKPEMVNRFEAETDTRHAQPVWEQQAAEKLAEYAPQAAAKSQD